MPRSKDLHYAEDELFEGQVNFSSLSSVLSDLKLSPWSFLSIEALSNGNRFDKRIHYSLMLLHHRDA